MRKQSKLLQGLLIATTAVSCLAMTSLAMTSVAWSEDAVTSGKHQVAKHRNHYVGTRARYGYHPTASGGTTGGSVNPGVNSDHRSHGYNGS